MVGILFCHPENSLGKEEIISHLNFFHHYSATDIDFYCVGYGAYWSFEDYPDHKEVMEIDRTKWLFSDKAFSDVIKEIENKTSWKFSGETELILLDTSKKNIDKLNFDSAIVCNLEIMKKDKAFSSVRNFFMQLFHENQSKNDLNSWSISDRLGVKTATGAIVESILNALPLKLGSLYKKTNHLAIRNIAK